MITMNYVMLIMFNVILQFAELEKGNSSLLLHILKLYTKIDLKCAIYMNPLACASLH